MYVPNLYLPLLSVEVRIAALSPSTLIVMTTPPSLGWVCPTTISPGLPSKGGTSSGQSEVGGEINHTDKAIAVYITTLRAHNVCYRDLEKIVTYGCMSFRNIGHVSSCATCSVEVHVSMKFCLN